MYSSLLTSVFISLFFLGCHPHADAGGQPSSRASEHDIVVYSSQSCLYCIKLKKLLDARGVSYRVVDVVQNPLEFQRIMQESGQRTVPQLFVNGRYVGGYKALAWANTFGNFEEKLYGNLSPAPNG